MGVRFVGWADFTAHRDTQALPLIESLNAAVKEQCDVALQLMQPNRMRQTTCGAHRY